MKRFLWGYPKLHKVLRHHVERLFVMFDCLITKDISPGISDHPGYLHTLERLWSGSASLDGLLYNTEVYLISIMEHAVNPAQYKEYSYKYS